MDVKTSWKWFNEVFYLEVKKRTGHRILLLMDNASRHFETFKCDNFRIIFFPQILQVGNNIVIWE
jgi:hypothetical protein